MNTNENPLFQIQCLLNQLCSHVTKINEIILQMNIVVNKINNPTLNQYNMQMKEMNNFMNFMNLNQMNYNINMENNALETKVRKVTFNFRKDNG